MRISTLLIFFTLAPAFCLSEEQDPSVESLYQEWSAAAIAGNHSEALSRGMKLYHLFEELIEPETITGEAPFGLSLYFDIGNNLIHLSRWEEAKFCFTAFLVHTQSEKDSLRIFGPNFSKAEWLRDHRIQDQPFYLETLPD